jgi:hypothetical protein
VSTSGLFVDLEIRIFPRRDEGYPVYLRLGEQQEFPRGHLTTDILPWASYGDPVADGQRLFELLFADPVLRDAWTEARGQAPQRRVRLWIDIGAAELHRLPWELLRDGDMLLSANADTPFSRYLPIQARWGGAITDRPLRMLVAVSNPDDLERYSLARLDVAEERTALTKMDSSLLDVVFLEPPITLERLEIALRQGYHILHYVGHGVFNDRRGQAALYLQNDSGHTQVVSDDSLVQMLAHQGVHPRLVFLATCQSATRSSTDAFLGLGPKLIQAGVPAVVAMQDQVAIQTARSLSEVFYHQLAAHGVVDLAMNEARHTLLTAGRPDASAPVLFMRLQDGRILAPSRIHPPPLERLLDLFQGQVWGRPARMALAGFALVIGLTGTLWGLHAYLNRGWQTIPGGQALLGQSDNYCGQPVEPFEIQVTEVTNVEYEKCVRAGACAPPKSIWDIGPDGWTFPIGQDQHPVWGLFWEDADAYCRFIGARLPTEAEWIRAARLGSEDLYPWGNQFAVEYANVFESGVGDTTGVTTYPQGRSQDGIYHLTGNVREWVADRATDPCDFTAGEGAHTVKGGSFKDRASNATIWSRYQGDDLPYAGVRCVRD